MSEPTTSLRDSIAAALEENETTAPAPEAPVAAEPASAEPVAEASEATGSPDDPAGQDLDALAEGKEQPDNDQAQQRERDESGKFKKNEGIQPGPKSGPKQQADRAPASWKPEVREHWAQLPEGVRAEVARREAEVARTLQETAEARRTVESVMKTIAPYEGFIRAEGSNPLQAIDNLMSTAARLRTGTAPELAQMVAGIVNQFGIGRFGNGFIEQLDSALAGQQPRQADPQTMAVQQAVQQQLAPVQQFISKFEQLQQAQQQQAVQESYNQVGQFLQQAEFGEDVREDMADLLELAQKRGVQMTLQDAYQRACMMNPSVAKVMSQRQQARGAMQRGDAAQRARSAAVSVSGSAPMGAMRQEATDVRSAIEAAIAMNSR
jgi:hypothetical protein